MSSEVPIYGIDKELAEKNAAKYDAAREAQVIDWIKDVLNIQFNVTFQEGLKDGIILCR